MLAALLCNQPYTVPSSGHEDHYKRRPNEPVIWCDDELRCQEELTAFKALPELGQKIVAAQAIKTVKASVSEAPAVIDAKEAIEAYNSATVALLQLDELNILLLAYFELRLIKRREEDDIAAMLMLGII